MRLGRPASLLVLGLALLAGGPARGEDPPAAPPPDAPPAVPPRDPATDDREADDALAKIRSGDVVDVMEGLEKLGRVRSAKVTAAVVETLVARPEFHVAEFGGAALAACDPEGALAACASRIAAGSAHERSQLCGMLAFLPAPKACELLAHDKLLRASEERVRRDALRGLGMHRSALGVAAAIDALGAKDPGLRNAACGMLGRSGDRTAVVPLLSKLSHKDGGTGGFAAIALGRIEDPAIFPEVVQAALSGNDDACKALVACARPAHEERLRGMLRSGNDRTKIAAAAALGKLGAASPETQKALLDQMLGDGDRWVRSACFAALGLCATPDLAEAVTKRIGQKDPERRMYVLEIAADVRAAACAAAAADTAWGEKNDVLRRVGMDAFWRIADPESIRAAEKRIREASGAGFERAMEFLSLRRNRNGFDLAQELLRTTKKGSREQWAVELCLERQTGHLFGPDADVWDEWIRKNPKFFEAEQASVERAKWREEFLKENSDIAKTVGSSVTTERAVARALDFLARHQDPSGAFDQQRYRECCTGKGCAVGDGSRIQFDPVGVTGLCTLAFFGAACEPGKGRHGGVLDRAMEYLLTRQIPLGDYFDNDLIGGYQRPLALQAYAEAAAVTRDPQYLPFVRRGVDFLACIQSEKSGWRYRRVDNASDTSVVAWVLFAAKSAEKSGARVRRSVFEGCDLVLRAYSVRPGQKDPREDYVRDIDPRYAFEVGEGTTYQYHTGYQNPLFEKKYATTGLGLMSRILMGFRRSHPFCIGSANKVLAEQLPEVPKDGDFAAINFRQEYPTYHMYYGTLAMHQMGGRYFRDWNKVVKEILTKAQTTEGCSAGAWSGWAYDKFFSSMYATALNAMTLETYYRYAPILQD